MTKRMLIDASHAEETRVVVLDGSRLEEFDVETATKKQLKGNIYLAKIVRVEPSLQAAFVEYGGGRHGFLAFGEIHPDYYQIPVADRQRLVAMQEEEARAEAEAEDEEDRGPERGAERPRQDGRGEGRGERRGRATVALPIAPVMQVAAAEAAAEFPPVGDEAAPSAEDTTDAGPAPQAASEPLDAGFPTEAIPADDAAVAGDLAGASDDGAAAAGHDAAADLHDTAPAHEAAAEPLPATGEDAGTGIEPATAMEDAAAPADGDEAGAEQSEASGPAGEPDGAGAAAEPPPETLNGGDGADAGEERERRPSRFLRNYKIQEVIRRRQILLVQVVKEERGTKGAALTTYISLAGRYSVLMPNSPRGGGVSRKITSAADRRRLKEITKELDLPRGMGMIVRTAGAQRPKPEITRDGEYLLRLWDDIRETTLASTAPALIHEEASLIKRAIRDLYSRDVDDVLVDGEEGWRAARDYMRMLMPAHARKVQLWKPQGAATGQPLFAAERVEAQLDAMLSPTVQLKSGGYLVINQTEALVAIDVNSGRSTRERGIEETALRTNLEASDEVARQLRLRDLAGLIVIDFIDMEARRHNTAVEKRLKDALHDDRARIQLGHISHFGLMEMSRQRLRPSLAESAFVACTHCAGTGLVRSTENACLHVLRAIEEEGAKRRAAEILVHVASETAFYVLNHKRDRIAAIEARYAMAVGFAADDSLLPAQTRIDKVRAQLPGMPAPVALPAPAAPAPVTANGLDATADPTAWADQADEAEVEEPDVEEAPAPAAAPVGSEAATAETSEQEAQRKRRRRRRRGARREDEAGTEAAATGDETAPGDGSDVAAATQPEDPELPGLVEAAAVEDGGAEASPVGEAVPEAATASDEAAAPAAENGEAAASEDEGAPRRRGRRGGRRRRRDGGEEAAADAPASYAPPAYAPPVYTGPTPADPFGAPVLDIFEMAELAEQRQAMLARAPAPAPMALPLGENRVSGGTGSELPEAETGREAGIGSADTAAPAAEADAVPASAADEPTLPLAMPAVALAHPEPAAGPEAADALPDEPSAAAPDTLLHVTEDAPPAAVPPAPQADAAAPEPAHAAAEEPLASEDVVPSQPGEPHSAPAIRPVLVGSTEVAEKKRGWWRR